jgi:hypothetical protein
MGIAAVAGIWVGRRSVHSSARKASGVPFLRASNRSLSSCTHLRWPEVGEANFDVDVEWNHEHGECATRASRPSPTSPRRGEDYREVYSEPQPQGGHGAADQNQVALLGSSFVLRFSQQQQKLEGASRTPARGRQEQHGKWSECSVVQGAQPGGSFAAIAAPPIPPMALRARSACKLPCSKVHCT